MSGKYLASDGSFCRTYSGRDEKDGGLTLGKSLITDSYRTEIREMQALTSWYLGTLMALTSLLETSLRSPASTSFRKSTDGDRVRRVGTYLDGIEGRTAAASAHARSGSGRSPSWISPWT